MKLLKMAFMATFLSSGASQAVNLMPSWYGGLILGLSNSPAINFNVSTPVNELSGNGVLNYSMLGDVGGQLGYRINKFRVEGEVFYNNNAYAHLHIDGFNIPNAGGTATTVQQLSIQDQTISNPFTFQGYTNTYALMLNGIYDIYIPVYTEHLVPYVGLGFGYEVVQNKITFISSGSTSSGVTSRSLPTGQTTIYENVNNFAGQAIIGLSYFISDHTSFALDFRYLSSIRTNEADSRFNSFYDRPQLYSLNFVFNSAFNLA